MNDAGKTVALLGGTGYVAGELLRLIAGTPRPGACRRFFWQ